MKLNTQQLETFSNDLPEDILDEVHVEVRTFSCEKRVLVSAYMLVGIRADQSKIEDAVEEVQDFYEDV